jgi:rare lipoprotein A
MHSPGRSKFPALTRIRYGVGVSLLAIASLIPHMVQAQTHPEDLEAPLRPEMQLPICGKIESATKFATPELSVKKTTSSKPAIKAKGLNQSGNVKEFSWLSNEVTEAQEATRAKDATTAKDATKAKEATAENEPVAKLTSEHRAASKVAEKKENRTDPSHVKVAKSPHCSGVADFYADQFHGRKTASGQLHDRDKFTAAHRTLPFGTKLKVVNRNTGKACIVTVNDRGPFTKSRIIDLSCAAAKELGLMTAKSRLVDCYIVENE